MDASLLISLLWLGWLAMLWLLKAGLDHVESTLIVEDEPSLCPVNNPQAPSFVRPDTCGEIIGHYLDAPIYRDISIDGVEYRFDHVHPEATALPVTPEERSIAPGIIYVPR